MALTLYMHPVSTTSRPVMLFIAEKNLPVTEKVVDMQNGEHRGDAYLAINPSRQVPALIDGEFRMAESSAILKYLAAKFDCPEYPRDLEKRAKVDQAMDWFNTWLSRELCYGMVYPQIFPHHKRPTDVHHSGHIEWSKERSQAALTVLDQHILGANNYVANNTISIADYFGTGILSAGEVIGCTYAKYPNIQRWLATMKKLGSWDRVNGMLYGWAGTMKDKAFETV